MSCIVQYSHVLAITACGVGDGLSGKGAVQVTRAAKACWTSKLSTAAGQLNSQENSHPLWLAARRSSCPLSRCASTPPPMPSSTAPPPGPAAKVGTRVAEDGMRLGCWRGVAQLHAQLPWPEHGQTLLQLLTSGCFFSHCIPFLAAGTILLPSGPDVSASLPISLRISLRIRSPRKAPCSCWHCPLPPGHGASCSAAAGHSAPLSPAPCSPAAHATMRPLLPRSGGGASQARLAQS